MSTSTCFVESVTGAMIVSDVAPQQLSSFDHRVQTSPFRRPITPPRLQQQQQQQQQQQGLQPPQLAPYLNYQLPPPQTMIIQPNQPISTAIVPTSTALVSHLHHQQMQHQSTQPPNPKIDNDQSPRSPYPHLIATISAGFEKGDYLIREEKGSNIYFDFFEEAYNFISTKGYRRMHPREEEDYMDVVRMAHRSVPGGMRFNSGKLLMVLKKELVPIRVAVERDDDEYGEDKAGGKPKSSSLTSPDHLRHSTGTLPTDADSCSWDSSSSPSKAPSQNASSAYSSYVDSWE